MNIDIAIVVLVIVFAVVGYFIWDRWYRGQSQGSFKPTGEVSETHRQAR